MRTQSWCWGCELCGHLWLAVGVDAPEKCAKCKRRNWHTKGISEVVDSLIEQEKIMDKVHSVPAMFGATPNTPKHVDKMNPAMAKLLSIHIDDRTSEAWSVAYPVNAKGFINGVEVDCTVEPILCSHRDTVPDESGNYYGCALPAGHKGLHKKGDKVGDIYT